MKIYESVRQRLALRVDEWGNSAELGNRICIYTTGSFGRSDASAFSDLDVFIVALKENLTDERRLTRLEEIELLASIVHVNRELELPQLDGDGGFLKVHLLSDYLIGLGKPSDDADNTFTGRLLLLLESKPILGDATFQKIRSDCIERYWVDFDDHADSFLPAFLINDILRFWRTLCVNYESGNTSSAEKRRAKNYKLKFSRLLTCFSAIVGMQAEYQKNKTVSPKIALDIIDRTPLERLNVVSDQFGGSVASCVQELFNMYNGFLSETNCSKETLYEKMRSPEYYRASLSGAREFGDKIFELMQLIASSEPDEKHGKRFFRYIVI